VYRVLTGYPRRLSAQNAPSNSGSLTYGRATWPRVLCVLALGVLLASTALSQYLEATIKLPDTLGPLNGPYHLAWDENPAHPRLYIGGEGDSGGVIVAEAITCKRLARISTGPVKALYFVPPERKLYVASFNNDSVLIVDCATNQVTSAIHTGGIVPVMQYNSQNDRLYCGGDSIIVVDCAGDTLVHTIAVAASSLAYDSAAGKLYAGGSGPLAVIDCASDSIVASLSEASTSTALCFNPTAQKVYAATIDTLFAIRADGDSVVARLPFDSLGPLLACDPQRNRIYCGGSDRGWGLLSSVDCTADTVLWTSVTQWPLTFLACNVSRDRLYAFLWILYDEVFVYDATTGQRHARVTVDGVPPGGGWSPGLGRLYCFPAGNGSNWGLLSAIDGTGDSIAGIVPLTIRAENIVLDTVHNRLYFTYGSSGCGAVGVVDCTQNVVTSYVYGGKGPRAMCYNPNNDRLYWGSGGQTVTVYDCSTSTVVGELTMSGSVRASRLHPGLNKLYAYALDTLYNDIVNVVDCERDSIIRSVHLPYDGSSVRELLLVPEDDALWCLNTWSVEVIDCLGDSITYAAFDTLGSINDACACPEARRIYAGGAGNTVRSVNMDKPDEVDTLHERIPESGQMRFLDIPRAHKAYWTVNYSPTSAHLFVIDTRTSTLADSLWVNRDIAGMCLDRSGNYVYCVPYSSFDTTAIVIDARADSVVSRFALPPMIVAQKNSIVPNRVTNRIYVAQYDYLTYGNEIPVIRDSMLVGLEELASASPSRWVGPTVVRRGTPVHTVAASVLWDATGREACALREGLNDVSHLAPGVYFMRERPQTTGRRPQATRKVVIAE
jgi:YVTN family beta-propeller protein